MRKRSKKYTTIQTVKSEIEKNKKDLLYIIAKEKIGFIPRSLDAKYSPIFKYLTKDEREQLGNDSYPYWGCDLGIMYSGDENTRFFDKNSDVNRPIYILKQKADGTWGLKRYPNRLQYRSGIEDIDIMVSNINELGALLENLSVDIRDSERNHLIYNIKEKITLYEGRTPYWLSERGYVLRNMRATNIQDIWLELKEVKEGYDHDIYIHYIPLSIDKKNIYFNELEEPKIAFINKYDPVAFSLEELKKIVDELRNN